VKKNIELTQVLSKLETVVKHLTKQNKAQQLQLQQLVANHQKAVEENSVLKQKIAQVPILEKEIAQVPILEKEIATLRLQNVEGTSKQEYKEKITKLKESNEILTKQVDFLESKNSEIRKKVPTRTIFF
jgi:hypothetical protein